VDDPKLSPQVTWLLGSNVQSRSVERIMGGEGKLCAVHEGERHRMARLTLYGADESSSSSCSIVRESSLNLRPSSAYTARRFASNSEEWFRLRDPWGSRADAAITSRACISESVCSW